MNCSGEAVTIVILWAVAMFARLMVMQVNLTVNRALNGVARSVLLSRVGGKKGIRRLP